jgi:hypothetical protein
LEVDSLPAPGDLSKRWRDISAEMNATFAGIWCHHEGEVMGDKKHASTSGNEARRAFRPRDERGALTEYEEEQRALHKNLERLRAERLAREAAKSKDN